MLLTTNERHEECSGGTDSTEHNGSQSKVPPALFVLGLYCLWVLGQEHEGLRTNQWTATKAHIQAGQIRILEACFRMEFSSESK